MRNEKDCKVPLKRDSPNCPCMNAPHWDSIHSELPALQLQWHDGSQHQESHYEPTFRKRQRSSFQIRIKACSCVTNCTLRSAISAVASEQQLEWNSKRQYWHCLPFFCQLLQCSNTPWLLSCALRYGPMNGSTSYCIRSPEMPDPRPQSATSRW